MITTLTADQLIAGARALIGTRWLHQGRNRAGVDCIGMVTLAMDVAGVNPTEKLDFIDFRSYTRAASPELMNQVQLYCTQLPTPVPGAMLVFQFPNDEWPRHFGIYTREQTVIHANVKLGRVVEHGYRMHWVTWTHSCWNLPGVILDE